ncbi:hypothetical protein [Janthinobacterium sp. CG_S6]|uniref:hypothetical protein n=1 Tax=unclassified Janthinobacterium TaxID=2610881 RepID=UPI0012F83AFC|nr:hypothetical protein [Janthinobacterium sp. CG3]MEC5161931.1 hypothetical protein [Janthinobacterium sp. CG_S6]
MALLIEEVTLPAMSTAAPRQSITAAQASVGSAAAWPTSGTIFSTAEVTRHGAATTPQPPNETRNNREARSDGIFKVSRQMRIWPIVATQVLKWVLLGRKCIGFTTLINVPFRCLEYRMRGLKYRQ